MKTKRLLTMLLVIVMVLTIAPVQNAFAWTHKVDNGGDMSLAVAAANDGDTIKLDANFDSTYPVVVDNSRSIILDLNNHKLNITSDGDPGIRVDAGSTLTVIGPGTINTKCIDGEGAGVFAGTKSVFTIQNGAIVNAINGINTCGGQITVTSVKGENGSALYVDDGGKATVTGNVYSTGVIYSTGLRIKNNSNVNINGNVTINGDRDFNGIVMDNNSILNVGGDYNISGIGSYTGITFSSTSLSTVRIKGKVDVASNGLFAFFDPNKIMKSDYTGTSMHEDLRYFDYTSTSCPGSHLYVRDHSYPADLSKAFISNIKDQVFDNKAKTPSFIVKLGTKILVKDTDYQVEYSKNKNVGKAKIEIKGINAYQGSITKNFKILPKKQTKVKSIKPIGNKQLKIKWKKDIQVDGYKIMISTDKNFKKKSKTAIIKKNSTIKKTFKNLKTGKVYYVKIRAYKTIDGKKVYGDWSAAKKSGKIKP